MIKKISLNAGLLATILFAILVVVLPFFVDGYSHFSDTVSELAMDRSPVAGIAKLLGYGTAVLMVAFGYQVIKFSQNEGLNKVPGFQILYFGIAEFAVNVFPAPDPLHNVFGLSFLITYMTPLVVVLVWKATPKRFRQANLWFFFAILIAIILNLLPAFTRDLPMQYWGLVQRLLLACFWGWVVYLNLWIKARSEALP